MMKQQDKPCILIVDDERSIREILMLSLENQYEVLEAKDPKEALSIVSQREIDLIISDLRMPNGGGLALLQNLQSIQPHLPVIMMTAYASTQDAIEAMKLGAYDYLTKPFKLDLMRLTIEKALEKKSILDANAPKQMKVGLSGEDLFKNQGIIGKSQVMQKLWDLIPRVASTKASVLIYGESGTGKEVLAKAIHAQSDRKNKPMITVNCAAIPEHLLESELFGYKKGAFTGAYHDQKGIFQAAHQGTLFLDEIAELPLTMQAKLLRAIQTQKVKMVGGWEEETFDLRIISATNQSLIQKIKDGQFREDLYYRLNVIPIYLPPLRERNEDIESLCDFFIQQVNAEFHKEIQRIDPDALEMIKSLAFPGNIRELKNMIERAVALSSSEVLTLKDFQYEQLPMLHSNARNLSEIQIPKNIADDQNAIQNAIALKPIPNPHLVFQDLAQDFQHLSLKQQLQQLIQNAPNQLPWDLEKFLGEIEFICLQYAIKQTETRTEAAKQLGISFRSLRYRLQKNGIQVLQDDED